MSPRNYWPVALAGCFFLSLSGCAGERPESVTANEAKHLILYEGLPHQFYESEALEKERKTKETVLLQGHSFYQEPLVLKSEDEARIKKLLGNARSFQTYSGEKKCGGFHPDYAVEWSVGGQTYRCLLCFGCHEARVKGLRGETFYDLNRDALKGIKDVLTPYRKNRPPHESWGP